MRKMFLFLPLLAVLGCTDASISHFTAYGSGNVVTVWSGGVAVKTYKSSGQVSSEAHSDGFYFKDEKTGRLVRVSGTVTIEYSDLIIKHRQLLIYRTNEQFV